MRQDAFSSSSDTAYCMRLVAVVLHQAPLQSAHRFRAVELISFSQDRVGGVAHAHVREHLRVARLLVSPCLRCRRRCSCRPACRRACRRAAYLSSAAHDCETSGAGGYVVSGLDRLRPPGTCTMQGGAPLVWSVACGTRWSPSAVRRQQRTGYNAASAVLPLGAQCPLLFAVISDSEVFGRARVRLHHALQLRRRGEPRGALLSVFFKVIERYI
jgi:hypothetical protein